MVKSIGQELLDHHLAKPGDAVVVGVSGGPDSMALLHGLVELNRSNDWALGLHVAHLNHGVRGDESDDDALFVEGVAGELGLPCTIDKRDVAALADERSSTIEETGRQERFAFFHRVCLQNGAKTIALAHQADDNAETILHRILRGTGLRGLAGIQRQRLLSAHSDIRVVRPLLSHPKSAILDYLDQAGIAYREDPSNRSNEFMRNRLRNVVLPHLEEVNPQVRDALGRLGEQAQWLVEFLQETVQRTFDTLIISRTDQTLTLNADAIARKSRIVQTELIRVAYRMFELGEQDLAFSHIVSVLELVADPTSGRQTTLPGGMSVEKRYHQLVFSLPTAEPREFLAPEVDVKLQGKTVLPVRKIEIDCAIARVTADEIHRLRRGTTKWSECMDLDAVHPPLVVRARRDGDRFMPLGAPGSKTVADYLSDAKIGRPQRDRVSLLCDRLGPIWIIGHRIDDRVKLTELTRNVLHIQTRTL